MMKIILKEDVPHLGVVGDLVNVRDGYGRNYLIPQGKAILASSRSARQLAHQKRLAKHHRELAKAQAGVDKQKIESLSIVMKVKTAPPPLNENQEPVAELLPKLFGSVTNRDIAAVLKDSGFNVDRQRVTLADRVGTVGKFVAKVRLDGGVHALLPFWVVSEDAADVEAAKRQVEEAQALAKKKAEEDAARAAAKPKAVEPPPVAPAEPEAEEATEDDDEG